MSPAKRLKFTITAVQASPVFLDREATIDKACSLIAEAARAGARLIVFPEAFIPNYPDWVWALPPAELGLQNRLYAELLANSVDVPGDATVKLCQKSRYLVTLRLALTVQVSGGGCEILSPWSRASSTRRRAME